MIIKKGDNVIIVAGADKGKQGTVTKSFPKKSQVIVEGVNIKKVNKKAQTKDAVGKIVEIAYPVHVSNVKKV